jgi:hypothetical protein
LCSQHAADAKLAIIAELFLKMEILLKLICFALRPLFLCSKFKQIAAFYGKTAKGVGVF